MLLRSAVGLSDLFVDAVLKPLARAGALDHLETLQALAALGARANLCATSFKTALLR